MTTHRHRPSRTAMALGVGLALLWIGCARYAPDRPDVAPPVLAIMDAGDLPQFADDMDYDGNFTAADVQLAGYTLISNEIKTTLRLTDDNLLADTPNPKCPPRTVLYLDLDGVMASGAPQKQCKGTSSSTRTRRVPR